MDIHAKKASDHVQWHNDRRKNGYLAKHLVCARALCDTINGQLREVVAVSARQHALKVTEGVHHGDDVILNITKVEADFHARCDLVVLVAPLREALEHVGLAAEEAHQAHDVLANAAEFGQERMGGLEIRRSIVYVVFQLVCGVFALVDGREEVVDNIVAVSQSQ